MYEAFHQATLDAGFLYDPDMNNPETTGTGAVPINSLGNIRMSAALTYLNPARHRLNLTVRDGVNARRVMFEGTRAVGVEAESGGEVFIIEGDEIVLCAGDRLAAAANAVGDRSRWSTPGTWHPRGIGFTRSGSKYTRSPYGNVGLRTPRRSFISGRSSTNPDWSEVYGRGITFAQRYANHLNLPQGRRVPA